MMARPTHFERLTSVLNGWVGRSGAKRLVRGEPSWIGLEGVAGSRVDADPEEVTDPTQVAVGGQSLVEDAAFSDAVAGSAP
jgi:hypothetical protein